MVFEGGRIPLIGVPISSVVQPIIGGSAAAGGVGVTNPVAQQAISQFGVPAINVALGSVLGNEVSTAMGVDLAGGVQVLTSQIPSFVSSAVAGQVAQTVTNSLQSSGLAGAILGQTAGQVTSALVEGVTSSILSGIVPGLFGSIGAGSWNGVGEPTQQWPGASSEPNANYGGNAYTTGTGGPDVMFSLQPANKGPQSFGIASLDAPEVGTTVPLNSFSNNVPNYASQAFEPSFTAKLQSMGFAYGPSGQTFSNFSNTIGGSVNGFNIQ